MDEGPLGPAPLRLEDGDWVVSRLRPGETAGDRLPVERVREVARQQRRLWMLLAAIGCFEAAAAVWMWMH